MICSSPSPLPLLQGAPAALQLTGHHIGASGRASLISPDWDFSKMGIGGLHQEFTDIFRRAFASRVFPPHIVKQMGVWCVSHLLQLVLHLTKGVRQDAVAGTDELNRGSGAVK